MKRWALLVVILYMLLLAVLALPFVLYVFASMFGLGWLEALRELALTDPNQALIAILVRVWSWIIVMSLAQAGLLVVPVRIVGRRPVSRPWVVWPIVASLALIGVMAMAMLRDVRVMVDLVPGWHSTAACLVLVLAWVTLAVLLVLCSAVREPEVVMTRVTRLLMAGGILELLMAAAVHVLGRTWGQIDAGLGGLWAGLSVMIAAFGPGVFFLFVRRWGSLKPSMGTKKETPTTPNDKSPADPD